MSEFEEFNIRGFNFLYFLVKGGNIDIFEYIFIFKMDIEI